MSSLQGALPERYDQRRKCLIFYMKSFLIFEENAKDKLTSIVNKFDYL